MSGVTTKLGRLRPWGMFRSMVVGLQYGEVKDAEIFHWAREPSNKFDANAISVHDEDGKRLGFLPSKTAAIVSPLVDKQLVDVQLGKETAQNLLPTHTPSPNLCLFFVCT